MVLERMVAHNRAEVARRAARRPVESFAQRLVPSRRGLRDALARPGARFIMEYKKASPSRGLIRGDISPAGIAGAYGGVADAISVVVNGEFFDGSLDDLRAVSRAVSQPVLCKDIVVAPYQLFEARLYGADAVLLMLSVLDDGEYRACVEIADRLGLDVITEIHDPAQARRAIALKAPIIGINNRDLNDLTVDLGVTERLARLVPRDRLVISESGIGDRRDIRRLSGLCDGFLVGGALMSAPRIDLAARHLVFGRVKVCGHTEARGLRDAFSAGAGYGGLIFARQSRRHIGLSRAVAIAGDCPMPLVGVFVNQPVPEIAEAARELGLAAVQLHGDEDDDFVGDLRRALPAPCRVWKAVRVSQLVPRRLPASADRVVLDSYVPAVWGGTGQRFDWWSLGARRDRERLVLAGGLNPQNAREAAAIGTWGLDVNSGVEREPGVKDAARLDQFFAALRPPARGALAGLTERAG